MKNLFKKIYRLVKNYFKPNANKNKAVIHSDKIEIKDEISELLIRCRILNINEPLTPVYKGIFNDIKNLKDGDFHENNDRLYFKYDNIIYAIETLEDFYIVHELIWKGEYNVVNKSESTIFIDIGMNVGFTSLFFSNKNDVEKVYAFEPFKETIDQALKNFELNKLISNKIKVMPYGLSDKNEIVEFKYNYQWKGSMGLRELSVHKTGGNERMIKLELVKASDILKDIIEQHKNKSIVCKIDCEGSEYGIIDDLNKHKLLSKLDILMIEWHDKGPAKLVNILHDNGFNVLSKDPNSSDIGMVYAFNAMK